jgi:heme A synthase
MTLPCRRAQIANVSRAQLHVLNSLVPSVAAFTALGFTRQTPMRTRENAERYLVCVSVVVVVTGAGVVVCCDVVVVLCVASEAQPEINARPMMVRKETISFFIRRA